MSTTDVSDGARHVQGDEELLRSLIDLERNTSAEVKRQRESVRVTQASPVVVRPGNASARLGYALDGFSADLSEGGARLLLPMPVGVGDLFHISFGGEVSTLSPVIGRCVRCRMLRDDAFESGFAFLTKLDMSSLMETDQDLGGYDTLI